MGTMLIVLAVLAADPDPKADAEIVKLQKERAKVLREAYKVTKAEFDAGRITLDRLAEAATHLLQAELDIAAKPADRIAAHQAYLKAAVEMHVLCDARFAAGMFSASDLGAAKAARLKAEIDLRRAGGKPPRELAWPALPKP